MAHPLRTTPRPCPRVGALALMLATVALAGCSDDQQRAPGTELTGSDGPLTPLIEGYPPGPYGGELGDVVRNYPFEGFLVGDPTDPAVPTEFGELTLSDLRTGDHPFALLIMAESWCVGSQITTEELALDAARGARAGGLVVEVLLDGDRDLAEEWIRTYELPVTTVYPLDSTFATTVGDLEWAIVIDLETQQIVWREFGSLEGQGAPIAVRGMDELERRCAGAG